MCFPSLPEKKLGRSLAADSFIQILGYAYRRYLHGTMVTISLPPGSPTQSGHFTISLSITIQQLATSGLADGAYGG